MHDELENDLLVPPNTQAALKCYAAGFKGLLRMPCL
jgi:hypothetical protein